MKPQDSHRGQAPPATIIKDQSALSGIKKDSAAIAQFIVETLFDRLTRYLMIKKVQGLVVPNVIGENLAIYRTCCNYVTIKPDMATF